MVCDALKGGIRSKIGSPGPSEASPWLCHPGKLLCPLSVSISIHKIRTSAEITFRFLQLQKPCILLTFYVPKTLRRIVRKLFAKI